jgi:predicted NBD/HSP70 family sugar kinase
MKVKIVMKDNYLDVQGEVACGRNGCLANWLNGL